jgi:tRNA A37 methylthiotransferase MiaB
MMVRDIQDRAFIWHSDNFKNIVIPRTQKHPKWEFTTSMWFESWIQKGQFVNVKITDTWPFKLYGEIVDG